jgi:hypothetical protein
MTAAGVNPDPLAALRLKLRRAGYFPVPCEGKRPPLKGWQDKFATNADEISLWSKSWHMARNTGALARHSPALDIDLTDEDAARQSRPWSATCSRTAASWFASARHQNG